MTATFVETRSTSSSLLATGVAAAASASLATPLVAAAGRASGISLEMAGDPIPLAGFATVTLLFSLTGLAIAAVLQRWAARPRRSWVRCTVVLTALSVVPDALADVTPSTRALLVCTHLVAAAIVVPALAHRLPR